MNRPRLAVFVLAAAVLSLGVTCGEPFAQEISRERAIEIARAQIKFEPDSTEAERVTSASRPLWRITFRGRLPGQPPGLFETAIIEVDRRTGEVVSIART